MFLAADVPCAFARPAFNHSEGAESGPRSGRGAVRIRTTSLQSPEWGLIEAALTGCAVRIRTTSLQSP